MVHIPDDLIRRRSYEIWQREGCVHGRAAQHWYQAQAELEAQFRAAHVPAAERDCPHLVLPRPAISRLPRRTLARRASPKSVAPPPSVARE